MSTDNKIIALVFAVTLVLLIFPVGVLLWARAVDELKPEPCEYPVMRLPVDP